MKALLRKRETVLRKIVDCSEFLRGSITSICSTCNRATCICTGKPTGQAYRLTYKDVEQKTRTVYISRAQLPEARRMLANHARMRKWTEELFKINIAIFKEKSKL
jgi:hypothetical protein